MTPASKVFCPFGTARGPMSKKLIALSSTSNTTTQNNAKREKQIYGAMYWAIYWTMYCDMEVGACNVTDARVTGVPLVLIKRCVSRLRRLIHQHLEVAVLFDVIGKSQIELLLQLLSMHVEAVAVLGAVQRQDDAHRPERRLLRIRVQSGLEVDVDVSLRVRDCH
jgi:hypothetical protein